MSGPVTGVARIVVDEWGVDFLHVTPARDDLAPLIPERDYSAAVARRCIDSGSIVVGEAENEYAGLVTP